MKSLIVAVNLSDRILPRKWVVIGILLIVEVVDEVLCAFVLSVKFIWSTQWSGVYFKGLITKVLKFEVKGPMDCSSMLIWCLFTVDFVKCGEHLTGFERRIVECQVKWSWCALTWVNVDGVKWILFRTHWRIEVDVKYAINWILFLELNNWSWFVVLKELMFIWRIKLNEVDFKYVKCSWLPRTPRIKVVVKDV